MRALLLFPFVFFSFLLCAQVTAKPGLADSLLFKGRIKGDVQQLLKWKDKRGENFLVLAVTGDLKSAAKTSLYGDDCEGGCSDRALYAYHFLGRDSLLWKVQDFEKACGFDNLVNFRPHATKVTDLDNDGVAEIWFMYSMTCASDVSPQTLKLFMCRGKEKYVVRGTSQPAKNMTDREYGGKCKPDKAFLGLPPLLKAYGMQLWKANLYDLE